jgi:hypothetical protein
MMLLQDMSREVYAARRTAFSFMIVTNHAGNTRLACHSTLPVSPLRERSGVLSWASSMSTTFMHGWRRALVLRLAAAL